MNNFQLLSLITFSQRIKSIQSLCSLEAKSPKNISSLNNGILLIFGQDGSKRQNKYLLQILRYLFVDSDLNDNDFEELNELVLLVQNHSVSVIWTHEIKKRIGHYFNEIPNLIEYLPQSSLKSENEMDIFENFKWTSFKRMMLSAAEKNSVIGVSLPLGCDNVMEIEEWSLLQSFALDTNIFPTGFFSAYYQIININTSLQQSLFTVVDNGSVVQNIKSLDTLVLPQMLHCVQYLNSLTWQDKSEECRSDDILESLSVVYEYGEMSMSNWLLSTTPTTTKNVFDSSLLKQPPVVLFSKDANLYLLNNHHSSTDVNFSSKGCLGRSSHIVLEGCEPSTSIKWCRTYFMKNDVGNNALIAKLQKINETTVTVDSFIEQLINESKRYTTMISQKLVNVNRLLALYVELYSSFRQSVFTVLSSECLITDLNNKIKKLLSDSLLSSDKQKLSLSGKETVTVTIQCMDSIGNILNTTDNKISTNMNTCWVYIRASICQITSDEEDGHMTAVSVGDTFLYTSVSTAFSSATATLTSKVNMTSPGSVSRLLLGDRYCLTHAIPYLSFSSTSNDDMLGFYSQQLMTRAKEPTMNPFLGLGHKLESTQFEKVTIPVFANYFAACGVSFGSISLYSQGFILENMFHSNHVPMIVSFEKNVERVWTVDVAECSKRAINTLYNSNSNSNNEISSSIIELLPEGILLVIKLKDWKISTDYSTNPNEEINIFSLNTHRIATPLTIYDSSNNNNDDGVYIGLYMPKDSRTASTLTTARQYWRNVMYQNDVPDHKFDNIITKSNTITTNNTNTTFPKCIYESMLNFIDSNSYGLIKHIAQICSYSIGVDVDCYTQSAVPVTSTSVLLSDTTGESILGTGFNNMRCFNLIQESHRLFANMSSENESESGSKESILPRLIVILGPGGSGVESVATVMTEALSEYDKSTLTVSLTPILDLLQASVSGTSATSTDNSNNTLNVISLFQKVLSEQIQNIQKYCIQQHSSTSTKSTVLVLPIIISSSFTVYLPDLLKCLQLALNAQLVALIPVINAVSIVKTISNNFSDNEILRFGIESFQSICRQICLPRLCSMIFLLETPNTTTTAPIATINISKTAPVNVFKWSLEDSKITKNTDSENIILTNKDMFISLKNHIESILSNSSNSSNNSIISIEKLYVNKLYINEDLIHNIIDLCEQKNNPLYEKSIMSFGNMIHKTNNFKQYNVSELVSKIGIHMNYPLKSSIFISAKGLPIKIIPLTTFIYDLSHTKLWQQSKDVCVANITNIKKILQFLFPQSYLPSTTKNDFVWGIPKQESNKKNENWFKRLIFLAQCKVFSNIKYENSINICQMKLKELYKNKSHQIDLLRQNLISIHGVIPIHNNQKEIEYIHIECSKGGILLHKDVSWTSNTTSAKLIYQGNLTETDEKILCDLVDFMIDHDIQDSPQLTKNDLSHDQLLKIQSMYVKQFNAYKEMESDEINKYEKLLQKMKFDDNNNNDNDDNPDRKVTVPVTLPNRNSIREMTEEESLGIVPNTWCFDGAHYIDENGVATDLHPNIENMLVYYLKQKNNDVVKYNKLLQEVKPYI